MTSIAAVWGGLQDIVAGSASAADISKHPDVFEVPVQLRNVYPANNFNRDVTTTWWDTAVLDGHPEAASVEVSETLKSASFIVLDKDMYKVTSLDLRCGFVTALTRLHS